jgi:hypothetical protein
LSLCGLSLAVNNDLRMEVHASIHKPALFVPARKAVDQELRRPSRALSLTANVIARGGEVYSKLGVVGVSCRPAESSARDAPLPHALLLVAFRPVWIRWHIRTSLIEF